ncbi:hypothetical protein PLICRDRAFT_55107 [Plicaturopsis crispa FD-325 SS-3]|nr:hypothetical protein PLICRDRAFT_55107 [Plicaturopsis crispa FD-325 SS-3]
MTPRDDAFDKFAKKDEDTGKKLWKLMKRISTGGMRERYQSSTSHDAPPPVPALPKGIIARDPESPGMISRFIQSRPSMTSTSVSVQPKAKLVSGPASAGGNRPSTTTRSSSPGSSDVASSRFFHRSHSTRSSSSSYGEELIPPMPSNAHLAQHILSPTELHRLHRDYDVPQSKTSPSKSAIRMPKRATTAPGNWTSPSPMVERPSLPFPPRRQTSDKRASISSQESSCSPILPSFSIVDAVNTFEPRRPSMGSKERLPGPSEPGPSDRRPSLTVIVPNSDFGGENPSPPPRPRKSSRRVPPPTLTPSRTPPQTPLLKVAPEGSPPDKRKSSGTHSSSSTARQQHRHTRSSSFGPSSSQASKSPLTFREMGSAAPRAAPLTEKEKSERWDDLLERSARAGGTIHMGGQELMSDKIRFSNISEMW